jgi:hypothetical protein
MMSEFHVDIEAQRSLFDVLTKSSSVYKIFPDGLGSKQKRLKTQRELQKECLRDEKRTNGSGERWNGRVRREARARDNKAKVSSEASSQEGRGHPATNPEASSQLAQAF